MLFYQFFSTMFEFREYQGFNDIEKIQFTLKWTFFIMIILRLPWCYISIITIINTFIEMITIFIGMLGIVYLKKVFLVSYCTLSEISFFLSSYGICSFLSSTDYTSINIHFGYGFKVFFVILFILWSLLMFFSIKLILDLFQTSESKPLLFSFSASSERLDSSTSPTNSLSPNNSPDQNLLRIV